MRAAVATRQRLPTPTGRGTFCVADYRPDGLVLLLGKNETPAFVPWRALEEVPDLLRGEAGVQIGSRFTTDGLPGTLDGHLKQYLATATAGWVAVVLERSGVVVIDRARPARVRLTPDW